MSDSTSSTTVAGLAAAQLVVGVTGQVVAIRRRLPYDVAVPPMSGRPENVVRDSWLLGTALSAPIVMLAGQAAALATLSRRDSRAAVRTMTALGALMTYGYLGERVVRQRLGGEFDPVETPVAATGLTLAMAMAVTGARVLRRR